MSALLTQTTIAGAVANQVSNTVRVPDGAAYMLLEGRFLYGSGGTTVKAWVQTRILDGTWRDVANFAFTTSAVTLFAGVTSRIALAASIAASDAALADNTILNGFLGNEVRVKYTTTGTYAGATSLTVLVSFRQ